MLSSVCGKLTMKIRYKHTKNECLYMYIYMYITLHYITLQTYETLCFIVRKSLCFEEHPMLLEMLRLSIKMYNYYYTYGIQNMLIHEKLLISLTMKRLISNYVSQRFMYNN